MDETTITDVPKEAEDFAAAEEDFFEPVEFDPAWRDDLVGLLQLGKLIHPFDVFSHKFVIKTLTIGEMIEIGMLHRYYIGSYGELRAWQSLIMAASIMSVDEQPLRVPISEAENPLETKFLYIKDNWYPWLLDAIYEEYLKLDVRVEKTMKAMKNALGPLV